MTHSIPPEADWKPKLARRIAERWGMTQEWADEVAQDDALLAALIRSGQLLDGIFGNAPAAENEWLREYDAQLGFAPIDWLFAKKLDLLTQWLEHCGNL